MSLRRGVMVVVAFALAKLTAADQGWRRVKLDNRERARSVYVYDTITTRGTVGRLPVLPYFKRACS